MFWRCVIYNAMHHYCFTNNALIEFQPLQILKQFTSSGALAREAEHHG